MDNESLNLDIDDQNLDIRVNSIDSIGIIKGSNYSFLRSGRVPFKSLVGTTAMYLVENAGQMVARFAIKTAMTFPWIYLNKYL